MTFNVLEGLVGGSLSGFSGGFPQTARKGFSFCPTDCPKGQELGDVLKGVYPYEMSTSRAGRGTSWAQ